MNILDILGIQAFFMIFHDILLEYLLSNKYIYITIYIILLCSTGSPGQTAVGKWRASAGHGSVTSSGSGTCRRAWQLG